MGESIRQAQDRLTREMMGALSVPFPPDVLQWMPKATNGDKTRALAVPYVDIRPYIERLNEVAGPDWEDGYEVQDGGKVVVCRLTICGVTRADVGEAPPNDENTATSALAQAFKRACVKFGLGAYLYQMPSRWVPYDAQRKRITDEGLRMLAGGAQPRAQADVPSSAAPLQGSAGNGNGNGNGNGRPVPTSPQALLDAVNRETGGHYNHIRHLFGALRLEFGEAWNWPPASDVEGWRAAGNAGVAYVRKQ